MLADVLAKIYLDDVTYATAAAVPLMLLISRFIENESMREFVQKFLTVIFPMLLSLEKSMKKKTKGGKKEITNGATSKYGVSPIPKKGKDDLH
jgi:hypothetical protein